MQSVALAYDDDMQDVTRVYEGDILDVTLAYDTSHRQHLLLVICED